MKKHKMDNLFYQEKGNRQFPYTRNSFPGKTHFDEKTQKFNNEEYRYWDPTRSKLAAAVLKGVNTKMISKGDVVLYLGSGHGYTPSFVSDIVGRKGMVFCIDSSPRVVRDLIPLCEERENMAPVLGDASKPETYEKLVPGEVDVVFQDVAQKDQVGIFVGNVKKYLKQGGYGLLSVKASSMDVSKNPGEVFDEVRKELEKELEIVDYRKLDPFEKNHAFFVTRR